MLGAALEFRGAANPVIEGFVLPEMLACPAKHEVCLARDAAFY
jgi:hypothetical protein